MKILIAKNQTNFSQNYLCNYCLHPLFLKSQERSLCEWAKKKKIGRCFAAAAAKSLQSCLTLCDPRDGSPRGPPLSLGFSRQEHEWVAISFSNAWKWKMKVKSLSCVRLFTTPWTAAYQVPLSMGFSKQEYWSGVPSPSPGRCFIYLFLGILWHWNRGPLSSVVNWNGPNRISSQFSSNHGSTSLMLPKAIGPRSHSKGNSWVIWRQVAKVNQDEPRVALITAVVQSFMSHSLWPHGL